MWSFIRVCACLHLLINVASLSTNILQSDVLSLGEADKGRSHREKEAAPLSNKIPRSFVQLLSNLRGSDHPEQTFHLKNASSDASASRTAPSGTIVFKGSLATNNLTPTRILTVGLMIIIFTVGLFILCTSPDDESFTIAERQSYCNVLPSKGVLAKPREELTAMESSDGTWARTYQQADQQSKQGLELLFRCHIIPTNEFADSVVSQEHIGECVWIAMHMLRERPLEEWLVNWPEAQRCFEESVTACFAARTDVRSSFYDVVHASNSAHSLKALPPEYGDARDDQAAALPETNNPPQSGCIPSGGCFSMVDSARRNVPGRSSAVTEKPVIAKRPVLPHTLKDPADRKKLTDRCRQIMAASDARKKLWADDKSPGSASSASPGAADSPSRDTSETLFG